MNLNLEKLKNGLTLYYICLLDSYLTYYYNIKNSIIDIINTHDIYETENTNPRNLIDNFKYYFYKILKSISMSNHNIDLTERIRKGDLICTDHSFHEDYKAYNKLLKYRNEIAIPVFIGILSFIIRTIPFLDKWYLYISDILYRFLLYYAAWYLFCQFKNIKNMLIIAEKIVKESNKKVFSKGLMEKNLLWIFGNYKILYDYNLNHDEILEKYREEIHNNSKPYEFKISSYASPPVLITHWIFKKLLISDG